MIIHKKLSGSKRRIMAAEGDEVLDNESSFDESLDAMSDQLDEMQDDLEEVQEEDANIEIENNIEGHYIAECEKCQGIFISAVVKSDADISKVSGVCPLCGKESDQYLKWEIQKAEHDVL